MKTTMKPTPRKEHPEETALKPPESCMKEVKEEKRKRQSPNSSQFSFSALYRRLQREKKQGSKYSSP